MADRSTTAPEMVPSAPTVDCYLLDDDGRQWWAFGCSECLRFHLHQPGAGHRRAHCSDKRNSLYGESGYNLRLVGPLTPVVEQLHRLRWRSTRRPRRKVRAWGAR